MSSQNAVSWLVHSHLSHKKTRQTRPAIITNYLVINLSTYFNSQVSWQVTRVIAACSMLQCCSDACSIAFNIVAWTKLMTLTNESTYFAFQMIWGEIVNLFLFHGVPGWCWCGPSGGDLSPAARTSHSPTSPWLSCWSLVTSQAGVKLSLAPAASISRSRSSLIVAWLETLQSPTCCPAPWLPHSAEARSKRKFSLETTFSSELPS